MIAFKPFVRLGFSQHMLHTEGLNVAQGLIESSFKKKSKYSPFSVNLHLGYYEISGWKCAAVKVSIKGRISRVGRARTYSNDFLPELRVPLRGETLALNVCRAFT